MKDEILDLKEIGEPPCDFCDGAINSNSPSKFSSIFISQIAPSTPTSSFKQCQATALSQLVVTLVVDEEVVVPVGAGRQLLLVLSTLDNLNPILLAQTLLVVEVAVVTVVVEAEAAFLGVVATTLVCIFAGWIEPEVN